MKTFRMGQRVVVRRVSGVDGKRIEIDARGQVVRLRALDDGAFVQLEARSAQRGVHRFPIGDTRERHVVAYPEDCDTVEIEN